MVPPTRRPRERAPSSAAGTTLTDMSKGRASAGSGKHPRLSRKAYEAELFRLQAELVKVQAWVKAEGQRLVIVFEGRDAAGKGSTIKRVTQYLNCLLYTSPSPRDLSTSRMPSSA